MLCEVCQQNPVTVHMQQIINGEKKELHLCQECSAKMEMPISFNDFFQGFIDSIFSSYIENRSDSGQAPGVRCPACNMSYAEFKKAGRFGCGSCYTSFKKEMDALFKSIQGSNKHNGKFPHKFGQELLNKRKLENLRGLLLKAVENEEYEEAASLRDQIKEMEKEGAK